ncbi:MAG: hypothetical protein IJL20_02370 [Lachnospiraceae bacterium]|nr:hypothetical protein [Lachnospiraceae bacterium]
MTYNQVQNFIENECTKGSVYGLERIRELLVRLDNPEKKMKIIHIAGTNGKGSISRMIMSVLASSGYKTGIFNSPFLRWRNEYLCINGMDATDEEYADTGKAVIDAVKTKEMSQYPTEFEFSFAMAMKYFADNACDFAIVECGLGGLSDATNIFEDKALSIIANIGLDHTKLLGDTIKDIAEQKCGIIIKNNTVIAYPSDKEAMSVIKKVCKKTHSWLITPDYAESGRTIYYNPGFTDNLTKSAYKSMGYNAAEADIIYSDTLNSVYRFMSSARVERVWCAMPYLLDCVNLNGYFQKKNAMVALAAVMALKYKGFAKKISFTSIEKGFKTVTWPGRFETLLKKPLVIADGGHNVQCAKALCESLDREGIDKAIFVIGIMADKDYKEVFKLLFPYVKRLVATEPDNPRRLAAKDIVSVFTEYNKPIRPAGRFIAVSDPKEAVKKAIEISITKYSGKMPVIITGSLYMMADIRSSVEETSNTFLR